MRYLGSLRGAGTLRRAGAAIAPASYDFDGFMSKPGQISSNGEIELSKKVLREVFGLTDIQLLTADGRLFDLRFSEKRQRPSGNVAHVDVLGDLPQASDWRH